MNDNNSRHHEIQSARSLAGHASNGVKKILSRLRSVSLFQGFVSLSKISGDNFAPFLTTAFNSQNFPTFINAVFKASIAVGAMLAVLQLARAGFMYMGGESWGTKEAAKQIMRQAVMGLLLLLGIWLILNQINPDILDLNILRNVK